MSLADIPTEWTGNLICSKARVGQGLLLRTGSFHRSLHLIQKLWMRTFD